MRLILGKNRFSAPFWATKISPETLFIVQNGVKKAKSSKSSRQFSGAAGQYKKFFVAKKRAHRRIFSAHLS
jgi:hypothetical protein